MERLVMALHRLTVWLAALCAPAALEQIHREGETARRRARAARSPVRTAAVAGPDPVRSRSGPAPYAGARASAALGGSDSDTHRLESEPSPLIADRINDPEPHDDPVALGDLLEAVGSSADQGTLAVWRFWLRQGGAEADLHRIRHELRDRRIPERGRAAYATRCLKNAVLERRRAGPPGGVPAVVERQAEELELADVRRAIAESGLR